MTEKSLDVKSEGAAVYSLGIAQVRRIDVTSIGNTNWLVVLGLNTCVKLLVISLLVISCDDVFAKTGEG